MRTEKIIAIIVLVFNSLTNLLMVLPIIAVFLFLGDGLAMDRERAYFVLTAVPCIVFSYGYSFAFIRKWFYQPYQRSELLRLWIVAAVHYALFLLYCICLFWITTDMFTGMAWLYALIAVPLALSLLGIRFNLDDDFAEQPNEEDAADQPIAEGEKRIAEGNQPQPTATDSYQPIFNTSNLTDMNASETTTAAGGGSFYRFSQWLKESLLIKLLAIGFLVLLLIIPNAIINDLIQERQSRQDTVKNEVSLSWGGSQAIQGPVLAVPYTIQTIFNGKPTDEPHVAYFLPQDLQVEGDLKHQIRKRSIFDVVLYQAGITLSGEFQQPDFQALNLATATIHWEEARLAVGIQGMAGIKEVVQVDWSGEQHRMEPGTSITGLLPSGVSAPVGISANGKGYKFSIPIKLNGSEYLSFEPVGKSTTVRLRSDWDSPSFEGAFLPDQRDITATGFSAQWQVLDLNRPYPQQWKDDMVNFGGAQSNMAVRLIKPVDEYLKNTRSAKYAILVIGLTFMLYFFFEVLRRLFIHPFQYLLVGLALTVFYMLLLSLSEHLGFNLAYLASSVATIGLICGYSVSVLRIRRLVWQLLAMLVAIYGFIFVLLQLEDFALLAGSIGVFVALAAVMFSSRKVDWYNLGSRNTA